MGSLGIAYRTAPRASSARDLPFPAQAPLEWVFRYLFLRQKRQFRLKSVLGWAEGPGARLRAAPGGSDGRPEEEPGEGRRDL